MHVKKSKSTSKNNSSLNFPNQTNAQLVHFQHFNSRTIAGKPCFCLHSGQSANFILTIARKKDESIHFTRPTDFSQKLCVGNNLTRFKTSSYLQHLSNLSSLLLTSTWLALFLSKQLNKSYTRMYNHTPYSHGVDKYTCVTYCHPCGTFSWSTFINPDIQSYTHVDCKF